MNSQEHRFDVFMERLQNMRESIRRDDAAWMRSSARELQAISPETGSAWLDFVDAFLAQGDGDREQATASFTKALEQFRAAKSTIGTGLTLYSIGFFEASIGHLEAASTHVSEAEELFKQIGYSEGLSSVYFGRATIALREADYASTIRNYERALELGSSQGPLWIASVERRLAHAYHSLASEVGGNGYLQTALKYGERALAAYLEHGDRRDIWQVQSVIAAVYYSLHEYEQALVHEYIAVQALEEELLATDATQSTKNNLALAYGMIGEIHRAAGNLDTSFDYLTRACELTSDTVALATCQMEIAEIHRLKGDLKTSLRYFEKSVQLLDDADIRTQREHAHSYYARALMDAGDAEGAQQQLARIPDSLRKNILMRAISDTIQARIHVAAGNLEAAKQTLAAGITFDAANPILQWQKVEMHEILRDIALKENDLASYVEHNTIAGDLRESVSSHKVQQALALKEQDRIHEKERKERERERAVLYSALPKSVADRVIRGEKVNDDHFDDAAVLFLDIAGFTRLSSGIPPGHVIHLLDAIFNACDDIVERHNVTKIKTIGDSYMAVAFPEIGDQRTESGDRKVVTGTAQRAANAALDLLEALSVSPADFLADLPNGLPEGLPDRLQVRIGLHIGPVVAGVIGSKRLQYDVWGDTVNTASRMESTGEPGRVHCSEAFVGSLTSFRDDARHPEERSDTGPLFNIRERGAVEVKGKGTMTTYWLDRG